LPSIAYAWSKITLNGLTEFAPVSMCVYLTVAYAWPKITTNRLLQCKVVAW